MQVTEVIDYNPSQEEALKYVLYDPSILAILYYGGVRGGKSLTGCKALQYVSQMFPGSKSLAARDTRVNLKSTTLTTFFGVDGKGQRVVLPQLWNPKDYNKSEGVLKWNNESSTCFWGLDDTQSIERVKSTEWSFVLLEECTGIGMDIITFILETRLSHPIAPQKMLLTTNTDKGEDEIYDLFFNKHTCNPLVDCRECDGKCRFRRVYANTMENFKNLPDKYVNNVKIKMKNDPEYSRVYFDGQFKSFTKRIYPEFDERIHVLDFPPEWEWADCETIYGYDHGFSGGSSCLLEIKALPDGTLVVWNEYYVTGRAVRTIADDLLTMNVNYVHCADPAIRAQNQYKDNGTKLCSVQDLFQDYGVTMGLADNDVSGGIERVKSLLIRVEGHDNPVNGLPDAPYLFLARVGGMIRCPNLLRQMKRYRNKEDSRGRVNQTKYDPHKEDDHAVDPLRYVVNGRPAVPSLREREPTQGTVEWVVKKQLAKEARLRGEGMTVLSEL